MFLCVCIYLHKNSFCHHFPIFSSFLNTIFLSLSLYIYIYIYIYIERERERDLMLSIVQQMLVSVQRSHFSQSETEKFKTKTTHIQSDFKVEHFSIKALIFQVLSILGYLLENFFITTHTYLWYQHTNFLVPSKAKTNNKMKKKKKKKKKNFFFLNGPFL